MKIKQPGKMYKLCLERLNTILSKESVAIHQHSEDSPNIPKDVQQLTLKY